MSRPPGSRNRVLDTALSYAANGWPVFPCWPDRKTPATSHGYLDATTDPGQITAWFAGHPDRNLAVATGAPGPDVLDVDRRKGKSGFASVNRLIRAGLADGAGACVRTPGGGMHLYFSGSAQRSGHLPGHCLDFVATGGYVLVPPSRVGGRAYQMVASRGDVGGLDWDQVTRLLEPDAEARERILRPVPPGRADVGRLAAWLGRQEPGNRNAGLFWAANRALDADPAADLSPLAAAARQAGLADREIQATLTSAQKTARPRPVHPQSPEAGN